MKSAAVDIEVDVAFLKIWRAGFPCFGFRIQLFNFIPNQQAYPFALCFDFDKEQFQTVVSGFWIDLDGGSIIGEN